jgi:colanic acid biosynthesis glycosyl transferase WcaI
MKVILVSCVFPPEPVVSSVTSNQILEALYERGHEVSAIVPFPSRPGGRLYEGYIRKLFQTTITNKGYLITRCWCISSAKSTLLSRLIENISFGISSAFCLSVSSKPDVIYSNTWPIFATGFIALIAKIRNIPLVISVQDIYPESLIIQKRLSQNSLTSRFLGMIDTAIANSCSHVIVISKKFAQIYEKERRISPHKISVIPNWLKSNVLSGKIDYNLTRKDYRKQNGIPADAFVVVYAGNIGVAADVETVVKSVLLLSVPPFTSNIHCLIAGSGSQLESCRKLAQGNIHITFHTPWLPEETGLVLEIADLLLLPTMGKQSLVSVPSKLITYLLSGKPILATALKNSDLSEIIEISSCGWCIEPNNVQGVADKITEISFIPKSELIFKGDLGRKYALENFTDEINIPKVVNLVESLCILQSH